MSKHKTKLVFVPQQPVSPSNCCFFLSLGVCLCEKGFIYSYNRGIFFFFFTAPCFNFCYTKANLSASSFKGHKVYNCKGCFLKRLFVLLTHTLATSEWLLEVSASFICLIISELYRGNIMSQLNRGYYESFTRAHSIKEYIKICSCLLTINTQSHCCLWEDNNILKCDTAFAI